MDDGAQQRVGVSFGVGKVSERELFSEASRQRFPTWRR